MDKGGGMAKYLSVSDKLLSLRGRMAITDQAGNPAYDAEGEFALIYPEWSIKKNGRVVGTVCRKFFAFRPTWRVSCGFGVFHIVRKLLSFTESFVVEGGPYDGAEVQGRLISRNFDINHDGRTIACATGSLISLRDSYSVEVVDDGQHAEIFTVCAMVTHHIVDKRGILLDLVLD